METLPATPSAPPSAKLDVFDASYEQNMSTLNQTDDINVALHFQQRAEAISKICETFREFEIRRKALKMLRIAEYRITQLIPPEKGGRGNKVGSVVPSLGHDKLRYLRKNFQNVKNAEHVEELFDRVWERKGYVAGKDFNDTANRGNPNTEYYTPGWFIRGCEDAAGIDQFDLDPASCPEANKTVNAKRFFTKEDNALKIKWRSHKLQSVNIWCNPPYENGRANPILNQFALKFALNAMYGKSFFLCPYSPNSYHFNLLNSLCSCVYFSSLKPLWFGRPLELKDERIPFVLALYCFNISPQAVNKHIVLKHGGHVTQVKHVTGAKPLILPDNLLNNK